MDWLRRIFGYPDNRSTSDGGPFKNPSWEEIFDNQNFSNRHQPPDDHYKDFRRGGTFSFSMGDAEDSFNSVFTQMDDMFRQLDTIMQGFHGFHGHPGNVFITEGPDTDDPSSSQSPRESLLKKPNGQEGGSSPVIPHHRRPFLCPPASEDENEDDLRGNSHFGLEPGGLREFGMTDPFQMMEDIFKTFGGFGMGPFKRNPGAPMLPGPGTDPVENPRDAVVKKDSDLDDRITGGFSELLKDLPGYNPPIVPGQPSTRPQEGTRPQPQVQHKYSSTSIVRIRRPDGSVEETRKYTDSSGREEVNVSHSQPEDEHTPGSLLRQGDQEVFAGPGSRPDFFLPSMFSWLFTR